MSMATHLGKWNWLQEQVTSNAEVRTGAGFGDSAAFDAAVDGTTCSALTSELHPLENMRNPGSSCMLRLLRFLTLRVDASKSRFPISQGIYNDMSTKRSKNRYSLNLGNQQMHPWADFMSKVSPIDFLLLQWRRQGWWHGRSFGHDKYLFAHLILCLQAWFCDYDVLKPPSPLGMMLCPFVELFCCLFFFSLRHHSGIIFAQSCSIYTFASYLNLVSYQFLQFPLPNPIFFWATRRDVRPHFSNSCRSSWDKATPKSLDERVGVNGSADLYNNWRQRFWQQRQLWALQLTPYSNFPATWTCWWLE